MTEDERFAQLLRSSLPPVVGSGPSRDLWPLVVSRSKAPVGWSWLDISMAAVVAIVLLMFPDWLWLLAYHL
jgi:hypothetical protein